MRFYGKTRTHTCGIDLHARSMYVCVLDEHDQVVLHEDMPTDSGVLLDALAPFRDDIVIGVECMFSWYWLADLCALRREPRRGPRAGDDGQGTLVGRRRSARNQPGRSHAADARARSPSP